MENKLGPLSGKWYKALQTSAVTFWQQDVSKKFNGKQAWSHFPESGTRPSKPAPSHFGDRLCQKSSMENKLGPLSGKWYKALQTSAVTFWQQDVSKKFNGKQAWTTFRKVVQGPPNQRRHILVTGCVKKVQWKTSLDHFPESGTALQTSAVTFW